MLGQRHTIRTIDSRIERREERRPTQGQVVRIHHTSVDLRVKGSAKLWKNIPVRGGVDSVRVGDVVPLAWWRNRPEVAS